MKMNINYYGVSHSMRVGVQKLIINQGLFNL